MLRPLRALALLPALAAPMVSATNGYFTHGVGLRAQGMAGVSIALPQDALAAAEQGDIKLIFPTRRNLERLALFDSFAAARAQAEAIPVRTITPYIDESEGRSWLHISEDYGYPVTREALETVARG